MVLNLIAGLPQDRFNCCLMVLEAKGPLNTQLAGHVDVREDGQVDLGRLPTGAGEVVGPETLGRGAACEHANRDEGRNEG